MLPVSVSVKDKSCPYKGCHMTNSRPFNVKHANSRTIVNPHDKLEQIGPLLSKLSIKYCYAVFENLQYMYRHAMSFVILLHSTQIT